MRSNKKEGGLLRRKGNRDVGPYLDKESFLHSSGFFGDGFMPNIPASVVKKREQASGKHKKKTRFLGEKQTLFPTLHGWYESESTRAEGGIAD